jgi:FMN reductase
MIIGKSMAKIVGISGSISSPSRTRALVENILQNASHKTHSKIDLIDIADIAKEVGNTVAFNEIPEVLLDAYRKLAEADLIVIASPVYKGSYTGLFKHFLDLLDPKRLTGKVTILAATGGSNHHALVLEHQFRPLASFFGLITVPTTIYALDTDFVDYKLQDEAIKARIGVAVDQALGLLESSGYIAIAA